MQEAGSELKLGWLSPKASNIKSLQSKQDRSTPDKSRSSTEPLWIWETGLRCHCWATGLGTSMPGLSTSETCANNRTTRQETRNGSAWLRGLSLGLGTWTHNRRAERRRSFGRKLLLSRRHNYTGISLSTVDAFQFRPPSHLLDHFVCTSRPYSSLIHRLVSKKNAFCRSTKNFSHSLRWDFTFSRLDFSVAGLALSKVSASLRLKLYWSLLAFL